MRDATRRARRARRRRRDARRGALRPYHDIRADPGAGLRSSDGLLRPITALVHARVHMLGTLPLISLTLASIGSIRVSTAGASCVDSLDCSLNGRCLGGECRCDKPWAGSDCGTMRFKPVRFPQGYGMTPNITSWGGGAIFDGQLYHAYIHTLANHCPLACGANSRIDHGVSDTITGPYEFKDVAVPVDARNSAPITLPEGAGFAIFHISEGNSNPEDIVHCPQPLAATSNRRSPRFPCPNNTALLAPGVATRTDPERAGSTIHTSKSLDGPWLPLIPNTLGMCSNPAPHVAKNGTFFVVCNHNMLLRADNLHGPWLPVTSLDNVTNGIGGGVPGHWEDPVSPICLLTTRFHQLDITSNFTEPYCLRLVVL